MKNNRIWLVMMALMLCAGLTFGCGKVAEESHVDIDTKVETMEKLEIVCTTFSQYDWMRELLQGCDAQFELTLLIDNGVDLHSYQPSVADIARISNADMVIYNGGDSEQWVTELVQSESNAGIKSINLIELLGDGLKEEELVEGMQPHEHEEDEHEDHSHESEEEESHINEEHHHEDEHHHEYDEHVWLSVKNAIFYVTELSQMLQEMNPSVATQIQENETVYVKKLQELDDAYVQTVTEAAKETLVFGDRFPFRYLMDDYEITYYAAFPGCSAETEASFETITFLAGKIDEAMLGTVLVLESTDAGIAETIVQNTSAKNQEILTLDSLQSVKREQIEAGYTYLQVMQDNLEVIKNALNK